MTESQLTILLVDDEDSIRDLAALVLEREGYRVLKASHSDQALILLDGFSENVHLLLTDVKMDPYMNGCELAKCIRIMRPETAILYISGISGNIMVEQEVETSRAAFLEKPFSPKQLAEKVRSILARTLHIA